MTRRFIGAIVMTSAMVLTASARQQRAPQPPQPTAQTQRGQQARPARIGGHPNLNGIWQALNSANWNLEAHGVTGLPQQFWQLGAIGSIPAGKSVIRGGGTIPYKPEALKQRDEN